MSKVTVAAFYQFRPLPTVATLDSPIRIAFISPSTGLAAQYKNQPAQSGVKYGEIKAYSNRVVTLLLVH